MNTAPWVEIDLDALQANLRRVRVLAPDAKVLAVIKADAYGHGMVRVARALGQADGFAVARVEEGILLRRAGIGHRIVVLQGFGDREDLERMCRYRLEPVIHGQHQLPGLESADIPRFWLKLDSGMHRLGLSPDQFTMALRRLSSRKPVLMTHLACADEPDRPETARQLCLFDRIARVPGLEQSVANSAAILAFPQSHRDWVRPGLMLYGLSPFAGRLGSHFGLKPVMTFKSRLVAVRRLRAGEAVGYGGTWVASRPTRLGLVAAGYGDGYPREVPAGTPVLIAGRRVPIVGRVSMDLITVDLTGVPDVQAGEEVVLWGTGLPVEEIAAGAGTIPYTLVCGVTGRVPRIAVENESDGARQGCL